MGFGKRTKERSEKRNFGGGGGGGGGGSDVEAVVVVWKKKKSRKGDKKGWGLQTPKKRKMINGREGGENSNKNYIIPNLFFI